VLRGDFLMARKVEMSDYGPEERRQTATPATLGLEAGPMLALALGRFRVSLQYLVSIDLTGTDLDTDDPSDQLVRHFVYTMQLGVWFPLHREAGDESDATRVAGGRTRRD
jgi:hypothetical protein